MDKSTLSSSGVVELLKNSIKTLKMAKLEIDKKFESMITKIDDDLKPAKDNLKHAKESSREVEVQYNNIKDQLKIFESKRNDCRRTLDIAIKDLKDAVKLNDERKVKMNKARETSKKVFEEQIKTEEAYLKRHQDIFEEADRI